MCGHYTQSAIVKGAIVECDFKKWKGMVTCAIRNCYVYYVYLLRK